MNETVDPNLLAECDVSPEEQFQFSGMNVKVLTAEGSSDPSKATVRVTRPNGETVVLTLHEARALGQAVDMLCEKIVDDLTAAAGEPVDPPVELGG